MPKTFNYMKRSGELIAQGVPDEEAAAILAKEEAEADVTVLDDGAWFGLLDDIANEAEREYQESLNAEGAK